MRHEPSTNEEYNKKLHNIRETLFFVDYGEKAIDSVELEVIFDSLLEQKKNKQHITRLPLSVSMHRQKSTSRQVARQ